MTTGPASWSDATATDTAATAPRRRLRWHAWRGWVLSASLAANVFLLAHAVAPMLRPHRAPGFAGMVDHLANHLPPGDQERFRAVLERERPFFEQERREMDRDRAELSRAIAANPYNEALVRQHMGDWQSHLGTMSGHFSEVLLLAIPALSPEGRARLADATEHPPGPPGPQPQSSQDTPREPPSTR